MEAIYNLTRKGLLRMRQPLGSLPENAEQAENWARTFSAALVRFTITIALIHISTDKHRMLWKFSVPMPRTGDPEIQKSWPFLMKHARGSPNMRHLLGLGTLLSSSLGWGKAFMQSHQNSMIHCNLLLVPLHCYPPSEYNLVHLPCHATPI